MPEGKKTYNILQKGLSVVLVLAAITLGVSFFLKGEMPGRGEVVGELQNEPVQVGTEAEPLSFEYRGTSYNVNPLAEYELWGLVVTMNNINAWYNYYHDKDSVNIKDICVIWGANTEHEVWQAMKFKSGEWTCYPRYKHPIDAEVVKHYKGDQLSNNHLLSDDPRIQDAIRNLHIGDQVYLKGKLVAYGKEGTPKQYYRSSSMSRTDEGNGACETFFVEKIEILRAGTPWIYRLFEISKIVLILLVIIKMGLFFGIHLLTKNSKSV